MSNRKIVIGMVFIVVVNLATLIYVNRQVFCLQQTIKELRGLSIKLPPEFESKFESDLTAVVAGIKTSADNVVASIVPEVKSVIKGVEQTVADVKLSADNAVAEMKPTVRTAIDCASSNLVEMCRSKVLGNELEAERSYKKAVEELADGDFALAKLYCMNAINHSPTRKLYFEKLLELSGKAGAETRGDLEQIKGALEVGIFQVGADDVLGMRNMLASVIEKLDNVDASEQLSREEEEKASFEQIWDSLQKGSLSCETIISTNSVARLIQLQNRLAILRDIDKARLSANDLAWIENQDVWTRASLEYFGLVNTIDSYLARAEKLLEEGGAKLGSVNVMVQYASQTLSQALGIETTFLPSTAQEDLQSFASRIEAIEIKFNRIKSQPTIAEIRLLIEEVDKIKVLAPYQEKIDNIDEALSMISQKMTGVFDADARNSLDYEIKKISSKLGECRQAQYKAYQSWAIDRCKSGMDKYKSWHRVDIVDAEHVVYTYLIEIDSTLLSPDVARLYQDVLGKQFAELKDHTVKVEINLAKHKKRQLSDF